jgi:hypothetical protein
MVINRIVSSVMDPVQSERKTHSKPRSLAWRMVYARAFGRHAREKGFLSLSGRSSCQVGREKEPFAFIDMGPVGGISSGTIIQHGFYPW